MEMNYPPTAVINLIESNIERIYYARELGTDAGVKGDLLSLYGEVFNELLKLKSTIVTNNFSTEYTSQLAKTLDKMSSAFPTSYASSSKLYSPLQEVEKPTFKRQQEEHEKDIREILSQFKITFDFFTKLDFLNRDLVIIGANGSGKTFLASDLMSNIIKGNGVIISAQRILQLPTFNNIKSHTVTAEELKKIQIGDKTNKDLRFKISQEEFGIVIQNLLADDSASLKEYRRKTHENKTLGIAIEPPNLTNLERTLHIWNSVFNHLKLTLEDGMNIKALKNSMSFSATEMSDGEKVVLFLIAQVLQSPENGFIIVDEPEMYLHPTIHKKLWDKLEIERPDSKFIYLTHNLEFAASRIRAKKLWLRSFKYPKLYNLEEIPSNEIPQTLLLELLGSGQNILFCEGKIGSLDEKVYSILFPDYIVKPVGGCLEVINFTKAFNKIPHQTNKAVGIIDSDYHSLQRLKALEPEKIFGIKLAEVENLFFDEKILSSLCKELDIEEVLVSKIKETVLSKLQKEKELQISNYVSVKVDQYFKGSNVRRGNNLSSLKSNYKEFIDYVNIDDWANERGKQIDEIIRVKDYYGAIKIFNSKGLESVANENLRIKDFNESAVKLLKKDKELQSHLLKHFPKLS